MKKTILVVEKDAIAGLYFEFQLKRNKCIVHRVGNELEIRPALLHHYPDVVIASTNGFMDKSCYEWAKVIRCEYGIPTILLSSSRQIDLEKDEFFYNGVEVLHKPIIAGELRKALANY
ncbi:MAG: hypothetical protein AB8G22_28760 [Saprospiraceae bacterium]